MAVIAARMHGYARTGCCLPAIGQMNCLNNSWVVS